MSGGGVEEPAYWDTGKLARNLVTCLLIPYALRNAFYRESQS